MDETDIFGRVRCRVLFLEKSNDLEKTLIKQGYVKRAGDSRYVQNCIAVVPKKKWYWFKNLSKEYRESKIQMM